MEIKYCTEKFLAESGLNYTILRPCGFLQGIIGQYAIPILEGQAVWMAGQVAPTAFMDSQDVARFVVKALAAEGAKGKTLPVVGNKAWSGNEIISLCERLSGKEAKVTKVPLGVLGALRKFATFFEWSWNSADRLAFAEILATGKPLNADMTETYQILGLDPKDNTTIEAYLQEYFGRIVKKLRELEYEKEKLKESKSNKSKKKKVFY
jgi:nucleoside-diphosphate-sugar epimerase